LETAFIVAAVIAALLVGLSKGGLNMIGSLAVPVLALAISPVTAAALLLPILVVSDLFGLWAYRRDFDARNLIILIPSACIGIAVGWATASMLNDRWIGLFIGVLGLGFCLNAFRLRHVNLAPKPADVHRGIAWGSLLGFSSFVSHSGGPPFQIYVMPQQLSKTVYAGTTTIVFAAVNWVKVIPYAALGQLSTPNLRTSLLLMPIAIAGTFIGVRAVRVLPERSYYLFTQIMLFIVSLKLIADAIVWR